MKINSTELLVDWKSKDFQNQAILIYRKITSSIQYNPEVTVPV